MDAAEHLRVALADLARRSEERAKDIILASTPQTTHSIFRRDVEEGVVQALAAVEAMTWILNKGLRIGTIPPDRHRIHARSMQKLRRPLQEACEQLALLRAADTMNAQDRASA